MSNSRAARTARGSAAAAVSTFVALFAHVAAGGEVPRLLGVAAPLILSLMVCVLLAGRQLSLIRVTLSVAASQLLFHTLFVLGTSSSGVAEAGQGHGSHGAAPLLATTGTAAMDQAAHGGLSMWLGHLAAGILTVAVLHRGESILTHLSTLTLFVIARMLRARTVAVTGAPTSAPASAVSAKVALPSLGDYATAAPRRGPPALPAR